jgi:hypothetical protein
MSRVTFPVDSVQDNLISAWALMYPKLFVETLLEFVGTVVKYWLLISSLVLHHFKTPCRASTALVNINGKLRQHRHLFCARVIPSN